MRLSLLGSVFWMSAVLAGVASCQTANQSPATAVAPLAAPQLSPGGAYQEALRPLTVTRASVANWSLSEQAALAVAIKQAAEACAARSAANWSGDSLVDLGHLCALGQSFPAAITAADAYLKETVPAKPRLAEVYAIKVDAELRLKDETSAFATTREMLAAVPYGPQVGDATSEAINFMQLLYTRDATALALARQPKLLAMMHASGAVTEPGNANTGAAVPDVGTLYREAWYCQSCSSLQVRRVPQPLRPQQLTLHFLRRLALTISWQLPAGAGATRSLASLWEMFPPCARSLFRQRCRRFLPSGQSQRCCSFPTGARNASSWRGKSP